MGKNIDDNAKGLTVFLPKLALGSFPSLSAHNPGAFFRVKNADFTGLDEIAYGIYIGPKGQIIRKGQQRGFAGALPGSISTS